MYIYILVLSTLVTTSLPQYESVILVRYSNHLFCFWEVMQLKLYSAEAYFKTII